ncbi:MAG: hypothetical protein SFV54_14985 [Bryobacteraceae bacterium]|nr:hypothetical protein [Bryobacteraceae bacterium]
MFDAVSIEHTMARFFKKELGERGTFYDADVFRQGVPEDLAEVLRRVAKQLDKRVAKLGLGAEELGPGALLRTSAVRLSALADKVAGRKEDEPEDYHWEVIGAVLLGVTGLLEELERQQPKARVKAPGRGPR